MPKLHKLRRTILFLVTAMVSVIASAQVGNHVRGPVGPSPYDVVSNWHQPNAPQGFAFGGNVGVAAESPDRIFILQRGESLLPSPPPKEYEQRNHIGTLENMLVRETQIRRWQNCLHTVDGNGKLLQRWDQWDSILCTGSEGSGTHRVRISPYDPEKKVWVVNESFHQIFLFSNDGSRLIKTFGERNVVGSDGANHLSHPTDVAFMPDGRVLIADGTTEEDNNRVIILDADLNYLSEFGGPGDGPGQFKGVHAIGVAPGGRLFTMDTFNQRVNVFRTTSDPAKMEFVESWDGFPRPLDIIVNEDDIWMTSKQPMRFVNLDFEGNHKYTWVVPADLPDGFIEVHSFDVDSEGNLYGADNGLGRTQKLVPKAGVNPDLLIQPPWTGN